MDWCHDALDGLHGPEASIQAPRDTTGRCSNAGPSVASRAAAEPNGAKLISSSMNRQSTFEHSMSKL